LWRKARRCFRKYAIVKTRNTYFKIATRTQKNSMQHITDKKTEELKESILKTIRN